MSDLNILISFFVFITGACIGSFLNVVALRGLSGESIVFPPSKCPKCGNNLHWYTNIPIISYIFLQGKCEFCKKHISLQYPIVEFLNALLYLFCFLSFGYTFKTIFMCALVSLFIVIAITDFRESVILDMHTYIIIGLGLLYNLLPFGEIGLKESIIGISAGFLLFEILARLGYIFAGNRAFGEGDTLIAMGIGAFFGWKALLIIIFMSVIVQAAMSLPLLFHKSLKAKNYAAATAYCALIFCIFAVYIFKKLNLYDNFALILSLLAIVCIILFWALKVILKDIKDKKETDDYLYLPFGPSLVLSSGIMIFYQMQIFEFSKSLLGI